MNLEFIKTNSCPVCGCDIITGEMVELNRDRKSIRRHANGGTWEERVFACGCRISYCPNFRKEEIKGKCVNDPKYIEMKNKREVAKAKLFPFIEALDTDDEYKKRLNAAIKFI